MSHDEHVSCDNEIARLKELIEALKAKVFRVSGVAYELKQENQQLKDLLKRISKRNSWNTDLQLRQDLKQLLNKD